MDEPFVVETPPMRPRGWLDAGRLRRRGTAFGLVALVVGTFLVANTLAMMLGERTREMGLLRAAGTTSRQVLGLVLRQGRRSGIIGSAIGIVAGIALAGR